MRKLQNMGQRHSNASWPAQSARLAIAACLALGLLALPVRAQESSINRVTLSDHHVQALPVRLSPHPRRLCEYGISPYCHLASRASSSP